MRFWLLKSEPDVFSFDDLLRAPDRTTYWDGVRNYQARNTLRDDMKPGDRVLYYHSNAKPSAVVGTATVVRAGYPDHTAWDPDSPHPDPRSTPSEPVWFMVDIRGDEALPRAVPLPEIKATRALRDMVLVVNSRLSVQPVRRREWNAILRMGQLT